MQLGLNVAFAQRRVTWLRLHPAVRLPQLLVDAAVATGQRNRRPHRIFFVGLDGAANPRHRQALPRSHCAALNLNLGQTAWDKASGTLPVQANQTGLRGGTSCWLDGGIAQHHFAVTHLVQRGIQGRDMRRAQLIAHIDLGGFNSD